MRGGRGNRRSYEGNPNNRQDRGFFRGSPKQGKGDWVSFKRNDKPPAVKTEEPKPKPVVTPTTPVKPIKIDKNDGNTPKPVVKNQAATVVPVRSRSRSPVNKNNSENSKQNTNNSRGESSTNNITNNNVDGAGRYTGRPGEKKFSGRCRLFIANMNNNTTDEELKSMFAVYGETGEVYFNKDKGFGFIRLDYRHNAELAKSALDKTVVKGRTIQVRFATHASALELHGLDQYASNQVIEKAMSQFGGVERAVIVCDDRGRSKGYAIVEFEWKKSAQKVLDRFKEEMFVLGRLPKPVFAKPLTQQDDEDGINETQLDRVPGIQQEREFNPRFISPSSFEYQWAQKWRDLYIEEQDKKAKLERELEEARYKVELEMETALREQDANRIREELARRQEELRKIEEDMHARRQMVQFGGPPPHMQRGPDNRDRGRDHNRDNFDNRGPPSRGPPRDDHRQDFRQPDEVARQNELILRQQAELEMQRGELLRNAGLPVIGIRPDMIRPGVQVAGIIPPHGIRPGMQPGVLPGPRGPPPGMQMHMQMRPHMMPGGPPLGPGRDMPPRGGGGDRRFDHKRPRRD